jgi:hypothetical protein
LTALEAKMQLGVDQAGIIITCDIGTRARARMRLLRAEKLNDKYLMPSDGLSAADLDAAVTSIEVSTPPAGEETEGDSA